LIFWTIIVSFPWNTSDSDGHRPVNGLKKLGGSIGWFSDFIKNKEIFLLREYWSHLETQTRNFADYY
jgi:hypothetical protein